MGSRSSTEPTPRRSTRTDPTGTDPTGTYATGTDSTPRPSTPGGGTPRTVLVGEIRRPHGVRGEVVVEPTTDVPGRFEPGNELWITRPKRGQRDDGAEDGADDGAEDGEADHRASNHRASNHRTANHSATNHSAEEIEWIGSVRIAASRPYRELLLIRFEGLADRDAVEPLRGTWLEAEPAGTETLEEDTYFHYQLVGCRCRDRAAGDLGRVVDVVEDGGGALLIVESERKRLPVPFVREFVAEVDVEGRRIELELPPGLIETCTSRS